ncbi:MAG: YggS family pyridoxal phosphate-dependent enzyme [Gemmatimonadetes bacterium]|nr:YggS family pyridoxal phosphate-dependent enzyme [Gemmatimonadota bacterium]
MYEGRLRESLPRVRDAIERAARRSGNRAEVTILGVTKGHPAEAVMAASAMGLADIGENRIAELETKRAQTDAPVRWHMVGHLQRNKVRRALGLFDVLHSVDSVRLAHELSREAQRIDAEAVVLVQINASGEESKGGFDAVAGLDVVNEIVTLPGLRVCGLMTMAPLTDDETVLRKTFARMRALYEECAARVPGFEAQHLSMGMSNDFEIAVEQGSNLVRLGTVLFGERMS